MERLVLVTENRSNTDLLSECRNGSREAMRTLYLENQRRVYSIALNFFGGDSERASDVTQQVFLKLLKKMDFRGESEFNTWLYRMTVNQCMHESRQSKVFFKLEDW